MTVGTRHCDVCRMAPQNRVFRYGLSRYERTTRTRADGHVYYKANRSMGGIDLCNDCWERLAKPKKRVKRA